VSETVAAADAGISGKIVLVTGAGGGIGAATAAELAGRGARVIATDLTAPAPSGTDGVAVACDVADEDDVARLIATCVDATGGVDGLVHCAGVLDLDDLAATTVEHWNRIIAVNLTSGFLLLRHVVPLIAARGGGAVVLIGSLSGVNGGITCGPAYAASKGGVHALAKWAAQNGAASRIRVNALAPGPVETNMSRAAGMTSAVVPLGRMGRPQEIAQLAAYLVSDAGAWITGQVLGINGGALIT
jgi:3-oxoacyl-[acyl-carrier protein] reductase